MKYLIIFFFSLSLPFLLMAKSCETEFVVTGLESFAHYKFTNKIEKLYQHPKLKGHWLPLASLHPTTGDLYYSVGRMPKSTLLDFFRRSKSGVVKLVNGKEHLIDKTAGTEEFIFLDNQLITTSNVLRNEKGLTPEMLDLVLDYWPEKERELRADPEFQLMLKKDPQSEKIIEEVKALSPVKKPFTMLTRRDLRSGDEKYQYPIGPVVAQFIYGDILYITNLSNAIYKINLKTNQIIRIDHDLVNWYHPSIFISPQGRIFVFTSQMNPNVKRTATLSPNTLYELRERKLSKLASIGVPHVQNRVQYVDNKLYVLLNDRNLLMYDLSEKKMRKIAVPYSQHEVHKLSANNNNFNLLGDSYFIFSEIDKDYSFENKAEHVFITNKDLKVLARMKLEGIHGLWNITTCKNPVGNFNT